MNQNSTEPAVSVETLADVPEHVLKGLPEEVRLLPSAVDKTRLGVWATKPIGRGRKFGPFVGDKKKRSQVKSNVFMWEVYYPNLGWMCVDATDPQKGNWLRYVNWARSGKEQNLFPLEINRSIYYKTFKPIEPGEELLVWYNGEDNPAIAEAIEEERASNRGKRNSPKAKKGKKKNQEAKNKGKKARDKKQETVLDLTPVDMREPNEGRKEEEEDTPSVSAALLLEQTAVIQEMVNQDALPDLVASGLAGEPRPLPVDQLSAMTSGSNVTGEQEEGSEGGEDPEDNMGEEEEDEEPEEEEEEEEEEPEEGDVGLPKESPDPEPVSVCEDKLEFAEEPSGTSDDSPESSPKKKPAAKGPKGRGESGGRTFMFPCQHCERKFATKQGLERHMHIHVSAIGHAFKCRYCGKAFGTQINRRRHERRHEAGPKRKPVTAAAQPPEGDAVDPRVAEDVVSEEINAMPDLAAAEPEKISAETPNSVSAEEIKDTKELHPCKYCRKVFGTHTNMRRHQRRVHERHLIPKGVRRKPEEPQPPAEQAQQASSAYVASTDLEEEGEADDVYIMDVSSNISENLNYYIDGKIPSSTSTSNCDVIEVESSSTELYGINCLLSPVAVEITPNIKASPLHPAETSKELPAGGSSELKKRRTASPPLLPKIKTELELEPITSLCSLTIPLTISTAESLPFPKEKSIYLSSKLKQLLQTQDGNKAVPSPPLPSAEMPKLGHPAGSPPLLPTASSRFKRRTSSPPSSPQHSPALRDFGKAGEGKPVWNDAVLGSKIPKLESHSNSPVWSLSGREEKETASPLCLDEYKAPKDWAPAPSFGNVCNQQPLDLSSSMKQRSNGKNRAQVPWESVLDLSIHKKPCSDTDAKESNAPLPSCSTVKKKPTTSMLQKVLLNEYNGMESAAENPAPETSPSKNLGLLAEAPPEPEADAGLPVPVVESASPKTSTETSVSTVPPLLTPTSPPSPPPCPPMLKVPTPPPPLLPTVTSQVPEEPNSVGPSPCPSPLSNATAQSPLPILSPTISGSPIPSVEPHSCPSPGPPTLSSSSSSSSSFSSSSSSSSSSSPSPPPLSVVSSVLSPGDNLENSVSTMSTFKQEELENETQKPNEVPHGSNEAETSQEPFSKNFVCNVCDSPFLSIKDLTKHLVVHAEEWPFKCEFCVQLFRERSDLSKHRFLLHGVGNIFVCSVCKKEFAFLCNLQHHQRDLHPDKECTHHEFEGGTLRPQNFTDPSKANAELMQSLPETSSEPPKEEEDDEELNDSSEELYTTIKIMASGIKSKNPDVRMGLNQHYPSFKPPPFQYHHRNPNGIGVTATNFTTHNIPQTFTTAIRCTKCGKSVDNMPELHKHILACASASDKKRYTPKKNPVPLKQTIRPKNGIVLPSPAGSNAFRRMGQPKRLSFSVEVSRMSSNKLKISALKKKNQLVQKAILQKKKSQQKAELKNSVVDPNSHICPYCNREFTYIGSLNKHASFNCPKKPASPSSKKKAKKKNKAASLSAGEKSSNQRRRTADAEIKMQSPQAHLGKTRARSSGPSPVPLPPPSFKLKQSIKFVPGGKSKKLSAPAATKSASLTKVTKMLPAEGRKPKGLTKNGASGLPGKSACKLHVRIQRNKVTLANKAVVAGKKKPDRFRAKSRERVGGPVTRSLQQAASPEAAEGKKEETGTKPELKEFRSPL
ncbi:PR domain zinc finger protein 2 [Anolis sagrei]|uniref:PR domain zinc finger protein 2 n=1 Tax=Anolis sagrei TaxID=38937 RepID=UPI0035212D68